MNVILGSTTIFIHRTRHDKSERALNRKRPFTGIIIYCIFHRIEWERSNEYEGVCGSAWIVYSIWNIINPLWIIINYNFRISWFISTLKYMYICPHTKLNIVLIGCGQMLVRIRQWSAKKNVFTRKKRRFEEMIFPISLCLSVNCVNIRTIFFLSISSYRERCLAFFSIRNFFGSKEEGF